MDDISDIRDFYDADPLQEAKRLDEHQLEFDITWRWLSQTLPPVGRILELGASTGRYTLKLAEMGYDVTAVDLSAQALELGRSLARERGLAHRITWLASDARDLSELSTQTFDAALVMGPLYHLIHEVDRRRVLAEVYPLLASGAPIISAFVCRLGIMSELLVQFPDWICKDNEVAWVMREGRDSPEYPKGHFRGYFCRPEEIAPLHEAAGFTTRVVAAAEPCIGAHAASYNNLIGPERLKWLELLFTLSTEPSMLGASSHLLYIGNKPH